MFVQNYYLCYRYKGSALVYTKTFDSFTNYNFQFLLDRLSPRVLQLLSLVSHSYLLDESSEIQQAMLLSLAK